MNLFELEKLANVDTNGFIDIIINDYKKNGLESAIKLLKKSGICIHRNRGKIKKYTKIYNDIIKIFLKDKNIKKVHDFMEEVNVINGVYDKFDKLTDENINLPPNKQVIAYLIMIEMFLLDCKNFDMQEILNYPEEFDHINVNVNLADSICESSGEVLRYFIYKKYLFSNIHTRIEEKDLKIAFKHIDLLEYQRFSTDLTDLWNYYDLQKIKEDSYLKFKTIGYKALGAVISKQKFFDLRSAKMMRYATQEMLVSEQIKREMLKTTNTISVNEQLSKELLMEYLNVENFEVKFNGIELKYLLRAYSVVAQECKKFISHKDNTIRRSLTLSNYCIVKSTSKWINIFKRNDIPDIYCEKIIDMLMFNNKSKDLHDCPFIKLDNYLVVVPSLSSETDASRALISNLITKGIDISIKGVNFEKKIHDILTKANIKNIELKEYNEDKYQCDCVFVLDNDVYFAEIKNLNHPVNYRDYQRNLDEIKDASKQLDRIADHFSKQIDSIKKKLNIAEIKRIYKIIITNTCRGENLKIGETLVIDKTLFSGYFKRTPPAINIIQGNNIIVKKLSEEYFSGPITSCQFIEVLENDPYIELSKERVDYFEFNFSDKFGVVLEEYISKVDGVDFQR